MYYTIQDGIIKELNIRKGAPNPLHQYLSNIDSNTILVDISGRNKNAKNFKEEITIDFFDLKTSFNLRGLNIKITIKQNGGFDISTNLGEDLGKILFKKLWSKKGTLLLKYAGNILDEYRLNKNIVAPATLSHLDKTSEGNLKFLFEIYMKFSAD